VEEMYGSKAVKVGGGRGRWCVAAAAEGYGDAAAARSCSRADCGRSILSPPRLLAASVAPSITLNFDDHCREGDSAIASSWVRRAGEETVEELR
jgi:hypothetical protein